MSPHPLQVPFQAPDQNLPAASSGIGEINALNARAWDLREKDAPQALRLAQQALDLADSLEAGGSPYPHGTAQALVTLGELANSQDAYGLALTYLLKAYTLLQDLPDQELLADASHAIGWVQYRLGNFTEAADFLQSALTIYRRLGLQEKEATVLSSQGILSSAEGKHHQALEIYKKALLLHQGQGITRARGVTLNNLALTQIYLEMYGDALDNAQAGLWVMRQLGLSSLEASILDTVGQVHLARGEMSKAEEALQKSLAISRQAGYEHVEMVAMLSLGRVYIRWKRVEPACQMLSRLIELAGERHLNSFCYRAHELLAGVYEQQGDDQQALLHYKEFHAVQNVALAESARYRMENLKILHQVEKERKDAEMLWLQNRALESQIEAYRHDHAELEKLATIDALTRLFNRRHFVTLGEYELEKAQRWQRPLSLIMLDVDHFKRVNDTFGHAAGDTVLSAIARTIADNARRGDVCCRYGGEEFVILLPDTEISAAIGVAQRICQAVAALYVPIDPQPICLSASLGVAQSAGQDENLEDLLERADQALYRAKGGGRNRVAQ